MRIITLNLNGIRSAAKKGFYAWLSEQAADIVCLQETKAHLSQLQDEVFYPQGYEYFFCDAEKKGYSGVAIYTRHKPKSIRTGLGWACADSEGRYVQIDFAKFSVASIYIPSGTSGEIRQALKMEFLTYYAHYLRQLREESSDYIICGDWNIAHKQIDLKNWRSNQKHSGFLPEERAWMEQLIHEIGFVDAFRVINQQAEQYTWWSNRGRARDNNVGWRIDYQMVTPALAATIRHVAIYKEKRFSDHAPLTIDYAITM